MRAMKSLPPPGANPTMIRMGFVGYVCAMAKADAPDRANEQMKTKPLVLNVNRSSFGSDALRSGRMTEVES